MQFGPYSVDVKNREKIYFPEAGITKGDLIEYYDKIAGSLLTFIKDRPLTLRRFPDGIREEGFYQKEMPDYFPDWIPSAEIKKKDGGTLQQIICNNKATLVYLVNQGTISFHPWLSTTAALNKPNKLVFDLDPPKGNFELVLRAAKLLRKFLEDELDLTAFVMTTGSEGLHVVSPVRTEKGYEQVRSFTKKVASYIARQQPDIFTVEMRKNKRKGRLLIDYMRNSYGQTSIPPYSARALEGAPVAAPLEWEELDKKGLTSQSYHIQNIFRRLSQKNNVWDNFRQKAKDLEPSIRQLDDLSH